MRRLSIALIGLGYMGRLHLQKLLELRSKRLIEDIYVYDVVDELSQKASKEYGLEKLENLDEIGQHKIDGAIIATPTSTHLEVFKTASKYTRHILLEKPPAKTLGETREIIRLARIRDIKVLVGLIERFNPAIEYILNRLDPPIEEWVEVSGCRTTIPGGRRKDIGVLLDLAIHDLYILSRILDFSRARVWRWGSAAYEPPEYEDIGEILIRGDYYNVRLLASRIHSRKTRRLQIKTGEAIIQIDMVQKTVSIYKHNSMETNRLKGDSLMNEHIHFINVIKGVDTPKASLEDVYNIMRLILDPL